MLPSTRAILFEENVCSWYAETKDGEPLGCIVVYNDGINSYLRNLFVVKKARRCGIALKLLYLWFENSRAIGIKNIQCLVILPPKEQNAFFKLFKRADFDEIEFTGEVYTFNPYNIVNTKFIKKTFERKKPFLPKSWRVARYSELSKEDSLLLENSKNNLFPEYMAYDLKKDTLELSQSFAFFKDNEVVGYITQSRLTKECAEVPIMAANPSYRGAGLIILKYYMFALHFETPEILRIRCHFTPMSQLGKKLFLIYSENKYLRHSLEYHYTKKL